MALVHMRHSSQCSMRTAAVLLAAGVSALASILAASEPARAHSGQMPEFATSASGADTPAGRHDATPSVLPFETRVELGEAAERKEEFKSYHAALNRQVGNHFAYTLQSCFAAVDNPQTTTFVLVADITIDGAASAIEVRPATNIAHCFAAGFARAPFPPPPPYPDRDTFPMTIRMQISD